MVRANCAPISRSGCTTRSAPTLSSTRAWCSVNARAMTSGTPISLSMSVETWLAGAAAAAGSVFEGFEMPEDAPRDASFAALHGLYWLVVNAAAEKPLLLALDDLHWVDRPSLRFVAYLARRLEGAPVLVATTLRSAEPGTDPALLGEIVN